VTYKKEPISLKGMGSFSLNRRQSFAQLKILKGNPAKNKYGALFPVESGYNPLILIEKRNYEN